MALITDTSPDIIIVVDALMNVMILYSTLYKVMQTFCNDYQGIWIIDKRNIEMRIENEDTQSVEY